MASGRVGSVGSKGECEWVNGSGSVGSRKVGAWGAWEEWEGNQFKSKHKGTLSRWRTPPLSLPHPFRICPNQIDHYKYLATI